MQTLASIAQNYQHVSYLILPLLAALWGMVFLKSVQVYQPELAYAGQAVREWYVIASNGRPIWRRAYDRWIF